MAGESSLMSIKAHSVVRIIPATEAAFSKATRVTFFGSMIPSLTCLHRFLLWRCNQSFGLFNDFCYYNRTFSTGVRNDGGAVLPQQNDDLNPGCLISILGC